MHTGAALWGIQIKTVISYCSHQTLLSKSLGTTLGAKVCMDFRVHLIAVPSLLIIPSAMV